MAKVSVKLSGFDAEEIKKDIYKNDDVGRFVVNSILRHTTQYVPFRSGVLEKNITIDPWRLTYETIYANRQWNGENFNFSKDMHPKATHHWTEIGFEQNNIIIHKEIENYIKGIKI